MKRTPLVYSIELLLFFVLLAGAILLAAPLSKRLDAGLARFRDSLMTQLESGTGLRFSCNALSPSIFRSIRLSQLVITDASNGSVLAQIADASISYNLWALIQGDTRNILREIVIKNGSVSIDLTNNQLFISKWQAMTGKTQSSNPVGMDGNRKRFTDKPITVRIQNLDIGYSDPNQVVFSHIGKGLARIDSDGIAFELESKVRYSRPAMPSLGTLNASVIFKGAINSALDAGSASLILQSLEGKSFSVSRLGLITSFRNGIVSVNSVQDLQPLDIRVVWDTLNSELTASLNCENLLPFRWIKIKNEDSTFGKLRDTVVSGNISLKTNGITGMEYAIAMNARVPTVFYQGGTIILDCRGTSDRAEFKKIRIDGPNYDIAFTGSVDLKNRKPEGLLSVKKLQLPSGCVFAGEMFIQNDRTGFSCLVPELSVNANSFTSVDLHIDPLASAIEFSLSANDKSGQIRMEGSYTNEARSFLQLSATFDSISVASTVSTVMALVVPEKKELRQKLESGLAKYALTTEIYFSTDFSDLSFNCTRLVLASAEKNGLYVLLSAKGNQSGIDITDISFSRGGFGVTGNIYTVFEDTGDILFDSSFTANTIPYSLSGMYSNNILSLYGDYNLALSVLFDPLGGISGTFRSDGLPVPVQSVLFSLSLNADFTYNTDASWKINLNKASLEEMTGVLPLATILDFQGTIDPAGVFLDKVSVSDEVSKVSGFATLNILSGDEKRYSAEIALKADDSKEAYHLAGQVAFADEMYFQTEIDITDSPLIRFMPGQKMENLVSVGMTSSGTPSNIYASIDIRRLVYRLGGFDLDTNGKILIEDRQVSVMDGIGTWNGQTFSGLAGTLSLDTLKATVQTAYNGVLGKSGVSANVAIQFLPENSVNTEGYSSFLTMLTHYSVQSTVSDLKWRNIVAKEPLICSFIHEPGITALYAGKNDVISGFLLDDGTFSLQSSIGSPITFNADGTVLNSVLAINVSNFHTDLNLLWPYLGLNQVSFDKGSVDGELSINGLLNDPEFHGTLHAKDIQIQAPDFLEDTFGPVALDILAEGKTLTVPEFIVSSKNGAFSIQSVLEFDRWIPSTISIKTATLPGEKIRINTDNYLFRAEGYSDFNLSLDITQDSIDISGDTSFERGAFAIQFANLTKAPKNDSPRLYDIKLNMDVNVGKKVEFRWPSHDFPILRGLLQVNKPVQISLDTLNNSFMIKGDADLKGGEIFYIKRSFYLRQGKITFNENQDMFDPMISLRAEIRERDALGEPVRIILTVNNQPLSSFVPILTSDPPKSDLEVMAILGQAASGDTSRETLLKNAVISASDIFTQMSLFRNAENKIRDVMHLDIFSIRTLILQNAILGQALQNTADQPMTIGNYFDNTTVYMGKYLGSAIYADALLHFSYYDPLSAQNTGNRQGIYGNLLFQPELGLEMQTPFFLLRWGVAPSRIDTLFVSDNSLTLSWKFSY